MIDWSLYLPSSNDPVDQTARPYENVDMPPGVNNETSTSDQSDDDPVSNATSSEPHDVAAMWRPQPEGGATSDDTNGNYPQKEEIDTIIKELKQPNACATDDSMHIILKLISRRFPKYNIFTDMCKFFDKNGVKPLNISREFAQVIFVPPKSSGESSKNKKSNKDKGIGHFLLLTNIGDRNKFQLIDSLRERSPTLRKSVQEILKHLLGSEEAQNAIEEKAVSTQIGNIDCGLYVIACLIDICLGNGNRLESVVYNQQHMRGHLITTIKDLFENNPIQEFPAIEDERRKGKKFPIVD
ncbi:uncharacterized protein LOC110460676 [Mizuhopecten yessoensis]|uniref:uncharacterized protein LOC110460676 n=1 Tax=Mizuhopecten yessoensis TaxID=6573 RepID=UPI000B4588C7|nr:uncharacterized protein LOC110460676 [Mizuhopecten yessoensis]